MKKIPGVPNWVRNQGFCHFLKVASLYFLDIAADCSLEQFLTYSRVETSKRIFCSQNWDRNDLFYSNVVEVHLNLLVIVKVVKKCCATHCQGNYTKDKQGKVFRQYRKKESLGFLLSQEMTYQAIKILRFVKRTDQQIIQKLFIMGKNYHAIPSFHFDFV